MERPPIPLVRRLSGMRRFLALAVVLTVFTSMGAQFRTTNFNVQAADPQVAQLIGQWAEHYRKEKRCSGSARKCRTGRNPARCTSR